MVVAGKLLTYTFVEAQFVMERRARRDRRCISLSQARRRHRKSRIAPQKATKTSGENIHIFESRLKIKEE